MGTEIWSGMHPFTSLQQSIRPLVGYKKGVTDPEAIFLSLKRPNQK
jgi:hypothetical protein